MAKLEILNLSKSYGKREILNNVNFVFESGKIYGLLGRNGAGKTTFFNCVNQDVDISSGTFLIDGEPLGFYDIGYVVSTPVVPEFLTAREFLQFFIDINKERIENMKSIEEYFQMVQIDEKDWDKLLKEYSHGMKNKMQILINIISNPKVILLDEPLTSLDVVVQEEMKNLFKTLKKDHILILSTHILELAMDLCDDIVILNNKRLEEVERSHLSTKKYTEKILQSLKDETYD